MKHESEIIVAVKAVLRKWEADDITAWIAMTDINKILSDAEDLDVEAVPGCLGSDSGVCATSGSKRYCLCTSLAGLELLIARGDEITWLTHDDGTPATLQEICAAIVEAKAKGYTVLPPCDNVDDTGHCRGHEI